ncbi:hypothetical protein MTR67_000724, partial [Solanum verrucosum]
NEDSPTDSAELKIGNRSKRDLDAENLNLHHEKIPTDRGSNDGPFWSTIVHVRGWVKEVLIHRQRPRTVV